MGLNYLKTFEQFLNENQEMDDDLLEKLIIFNNKPFQPFGNVVIMAGGAGSGKGFIKSNILGMDGWGFDVDELKSLAMGSTKFSAKVKEETGVDITKMDLRTPEDVAQLHHIVNDVYGVDQKKMQRIYTSVLAAHPDRKPNLIFDVTLKNIKKLNEIAQFAHELGYDMEHIHIVWVINHIELAKKQNLNRSRIVPEDILVATHEGASATMLKIINMGEDVSRYMNGDIVFCFAQAGVDTNLVTKKQDIPSDIGTVSKHKGGTVMYMNETFFSYAKRAGQPTLPLDKIADDVIAKINEYTPIEWR
jgi:predicted kinase